MARLILVVLFGAEVSLRPCHVGVNSTRTASLPKSASSANSRAKPPKDGNHRLTRTHVPFRPLAEEE